MNAAIARTVIRRTAGVSMRRLMINNNCNIVKFSVPNRIHHFSSVATNVHDLLQRELDEEMKAGTDEMPQDLEELKNKLSADWRIVDDATTGSVKLFSKGTSAPKVSVVFHCQDTLEAEYDEEQEQEEGDDPAVSVRFAVTATKAGKTMVFTCLSENAEASVETVSITSDLEGAQATGKVAPDLYQVSTLIVSTRCKLLSPPLSYLLLLSFP